MCSNIKTQSYRMLSTRQEDPRLALCLNCKDSSDRPEIDFECWKIYSSIPYKSLSWLKGQRVFAGGIYRKDYLSTPVCRKEYVISKGHRSTLFKFRILIQHLTTLTGRWYWIIAIDWIYTFCNTDELAHKFHYY